MSSYTVENLMFGLQSNPVLMERFIADPASVIADYPLTEEEKQDILSWNVRALSERGVSDMLMFVTFTAVNGQQSVPDYMRRMNTPPGVSAA